VPFAALIALLGLRDVLVHAVAELVAERFFKLSCALGFRIVLHEIAAAVRSAIWRARFSYIDSIS
jgi:hypothetical protein